LTRVCLSVCPLVSRITEKVTVGCSLHWLPVRERVTFKTAVLVWKCLHDVAPRYIADLYVPTAATAGRRQSRSAVSGALVVPWTRRWLGSRVAKALDLQLAGCEFNSRPRRCWVTTLGKLFTPTCLGMWFSDGMTDCDVRCRGQLC